MENLNLGEQIAFYRKERSMTQEALAQALGVSNQAVSKWESNVCCPDVQLLPRLADLFEVSLDRLFGREADVEVLPWEDDENLRAVLYVGRKLQAHQGLDRYSREKALVELRYEGPACNVFSNFAVTCQDVAGDVRAGDAVSCGDVGGSVTAGDGVNCSNVGGDVHAGDSVSCADVLHGDVRAGDSVTCGDVHGDVHAGDSVYCGSVDGDIHHG